MRGEGERRSETTGVCDLVDGEGGVYLGGYRDGVSNQCSCLIVQYYAFRCSGHGARNRGDDIDRRVLGWGGWWIMFIFKTKH